MLKILNPGKWLPGLRLSVCLFGMTSASLFAADKTYDVAAGATQTESSVITNAYVNVVKTGGGELIFNMASSNTFTGYTDVQAGKLTITNGVRESLFGSALKIASGALVTIQQDHVVGLSGSANLAIGGTLDMTDKWIIINNLDFTADGSIFTGNLRSDGTPPTVRVSGDITATGNASFGAYTTGKILHLRLNSAGSYGSDGDHTITVASGKTLNVFGALQKEGGGNLIIRKKGAGELVFDRTDVNAGLLSGTTYIDEGKITLKGAASKKLTNNIVIAKGATLDMTSSGQLDGTALTIAGTFNFTGGTTHSTVTLNQNGAKVTGSASSFLYGSINVTENAAFTGTQLVPNQAAANINVAAGKTLSVSGFQLRNLTNQVHLTGPGTVVVTAESTVQAAGATIFVDSGTLKMGDHHTLKQVSFDISTKFDLGKLWNSDTRNLTFSKDGALIQGAWRPATEGEASYGVLRILGNVTANANANITDTTLLFMDGSHSFTVADGKSLTINQNIGQNFATTSTSLVKDGNGTLQLANLNTRSEATSFADREFKGGFNIKDGTVLASGKFSGAVTLAAGAELSPGTLTNGTMEGTAGTLQLASLENNGLITLDILGENSFDTLNVSGTFDSADGDILVNVLGDYVPETTDTFKLFTGTLPTDANFLFAGNAGTVFSYLAATGEVSLRNANATPEPSSAILLLVGLGFLFWRSRK